MQRRDLTLIAVALLGALLTGAYALSQDKQLGADLMRALFGLSGGNTAGGQ